MLRTRILVALLALAAVTLPLRFASADDAAADAELQQKLIAVLQSDAPPADKAITCKKLAVYGDKRAVPALAELLANEELCSWARIALEAIPDVEAGAALREAAAQLQGRPLVGVLNSIGVRRDAQAVDVLVERLPDADAEVASAAAVALGRIGGEEAAKALLPKLTAAPNAVRSAVAEGLILCAEQALAADNADEAIRIFDLVRGADVAKQRRLEATRGAILARGADGVPLLIEQLQSPDKAFFAIGLTVARELPGPETTEALTAGLESADASRQPLLILALADRGDKAAVTALLETAKSGSHDARIAAFRVLQRLGDASCIAVLLDAAQESDAELSQVALDVLAGLPGDDVDADLVARLKTARGKARRVLIEVAGWRRIAATAPALVAAADDSDAQIRAAALTALGSVVSFGDLAVLIERVVDPPASAEETAVAQAALRTACERMPDREACAAKLVAAMKSAPVPSRCSMLEVLAAMGGPTALQAVGAAAKAPQEELQDAASRLLGQWMTVDAGPVLLNLSTAAPGRKYQVRALRGYIRLARQFTMPEPDRAAMCRAALKVAQRDDERKLVLEVLERYPNVDTLRISVEAAKIASLKSDAAGVSLAIAQKIGGSADVRQLLTQLGQEPVKVEIVKAEYGAGSTMKDVTETLRKHVRDFPLIVLPSSSYNGALGGDPAPGIVKQLKIQYKIDGKAGEASFAENATILLPMPK